MLSFPDGVSQRYEETRQEGVHTVPHTSAHTHTDVHSYTAGLFKAPRHLREVRVKMSNSAAVTPLLEHAHTHMLAHRHCERDVHTHAVRKGRESVEEASVNTLISTLRGHFIRHTF